MKKIIVFLFLAFLTSGSLFAQYQSYRVQKNENIDSLAHKFQVKKSAILKLNPDWKKGEMSGKVIVVPPKETEENTPKATSVRFREYRVKKKETLYSLAKNNDISIEDIKRYNPYLYKEELGENDMIRIPIFQDGNQDFNASMQTSTFKNLIHVVMPKQTKYGISKKYGMTVKQLDSLNPMLDVLHPGQVLKVINPLTKNETEDTFAYYKVQPKETFYSLTKRLEISRDSLENLNPILKELGLQAGMELKIPKELGSFTDIEQGSLKKLDLSQHLTNLSTKNIVIMLPFNLQKYEGEDLNERAILKKDQVAQISLDFYSGAKAAIDSVQKLGIPVNAEVFDTQANTGKIDQILKQNNFNQTQVIIGPLLSNNIEKVAKKFKNRKVAIFSPLTNDELQGSDKIFQTRPSNLVKQKVLMSYLDSLQSGKNLLILSDKKHSFFSDKLQAHFPSARLIKQAEKDYLQKSDLMKLLDKDKPNWVIMETSDFGAISNAMSYFNAMRSVYDIRVFTSDKNSVYDEEVPPEFFSHLNFTYTSVDLSEASNEHSTFVKSYLKKYGISPSQYATRGFDVTFDALLRSASADNIFKSFKKQKGTTEYVDNRFNYQKKLLGGYYNSAVYLIKFDKDLELKVLN